MQLPNVLHYVGMMRRNRWVIGMSFSLAYTFVGWFYTNDIESTLYCMARATDVNCWSQFRTNLQEQSKQW